MIEPRTVTVCINYSNDDKKQYTLQTRRSLAHILAVEIDKLNSVLSNDYRLSVGTCHYNLDCIDIYYTKQTN